MLASVVTKNRLVRHGMDTSAQVRGYFDLTKDNLARVPLQPTKTRRRTVRYDLSFQAATEFPVAVNSLDSFLLESLG